MNELPLYEVIFEEGQTIGVYGISLVDRPANGLMAIKFSDVEFHPNCKCELIEGQVIGEPSQCDYCKLKAKELESDLKMNIKMSSIDKRILTCAVLIPNQRITREDEDGKYNIFFTESLIEQIQQNFFKNGYQNNSTINHIEPINGVYFFESWIIEDPNNDKANAIGFKGLPKGTLMMSMKVDNKEVWDNYIKGGDFRGFSIDSVFKLKRVNNININNKEMNLSKETIVSALKDAMKQIKLEDMVPNEQPEMSPLEVTPENVDELSKILPEGITVDQILSALGLTISTREEDVMEAPEVEVPEVEVELEDSTISQTPLVPATEMAPDMKSELDAKDAEIASLKAKLADLEAQLVSSKDAIVKMSNQPASTGIKNVDLSSKSSPSTKIGRLLEAVNSIK